MASDGPNMQRTTFTSVLFFVFVAVAAEAQLSTSYYDSTCPQAASIVQAKVDAFVESDRGLAAALMRLHFHDCFVRGCDGSVLLNSTDSNILTEKSALLNNNSLRGFEQIDEIKMELECACPGVVSCADILALVARDATVKVGGWSWPVFLGRIDGAGSFADEVNGSLPERRDNFTKLVETFAKVGLDAKDMIILSGGHSIGQVHCGAFFERLYNFQGLNITDPSMDPEFAVMLKAQCPPTRPFDFMALDATNGTFDSTYYLDLLTNKGLLESDVALLSDPLGVEYAIKAVQDPNTFLFEFGMAMIKMGNIPASDPYGWRKHCAFTEPKF
ncbi:peroxidase [Marchantia polymorpha subsp. ruderalis]|uniref:Peroxidase n=2 Tax=Marchantia polymorpha TaxID=3197 RepID=A0AAF6BH20_MARPO|nr:hypothetical protein MARPO_0417s0001 [Marchantia polymorpha]BBN11304.1 hypothetical protein Mp_5g10750 [Marchantia polymorpha subsp. ruderalis]|eukprot:PTQ26768.1 hypothetical protein MARPO_0417s0001 [Marchantia polymorpha]